MIGGKREEELEGTWVGKEMEREWRWGVRVLSDITNFDIKYILLIKALFQFPSL